MHLLKQKHASGLDIYGPANMPLLGHKIRLARPCTPFNEPGPRLSAWGERQQGAAADVSWPDMDRGF